MQRLAKAALGLDQVLGERGDGRLVDGAAAHRQRLTAPHRRPLL
jgi:hypothetical protein